MIQHSVIFNLKPAPGSAGEQAFFAAARQLETIPGVEQFACLRQLSPKNPYAFGLSMIFASQEIYDRYNHHPIHQAFIRQFWLKEVIGFLEIDFQPLQ